MPTDQTMEQEFEAVPVIPPKEEKPTHKTILTAGGLILVVAVAAFLLLLFLTSQKPGEKNFFPVVPSPTPIITEATTRSSSPYATDSAVLKIEEDLKNLDQELQSTDLKEAGLNPPVLDMEVK